MTSIESTLNPALKSFWKTPARNRVLYGGRSSSKSWDAAGMAIAIAQFCRVRILCTRQFQNKIDESVYTLLKIQIERFGLQDKFKVLDNKIICISTGSEFLFYGLWRNIGEIKSLESVDIHWAEEAHMLTKSQWEIINPTLRKDSSQHWIIFNPQLSTDFVYQNFVVNPPANTIVRKINFDENPFLSKTMLDVIEDAKNDEDFDHVYLGEPRNTDDEAVIQRKHVLASIDAHKSLNIEPSGTKRIGFDVADAGEDACATVSAYGQLTTDCTLWKAKEDELLLSCTKVFSLAIQQEADIIYDAIGVGASCGAKFTELNIAQGRKIKHSKFFAGGAVYNPDKMYNKTKIKNRDFFANIKAQAWWMISDRFIDTFNAVKNGHEFNPNELLFIDSSLPYLNKLIDELCTPKRSFDASGKVMVESKKDLKKRDIASPNLADAYVMTHVILPKSGSF